MLAHTGVRSFAFAQDDIFSINILVSQTGVPAYIGYMFPIVTVIAVLIVKKYRKKLKKYFE